MCIMYYDMIHMRQQKCNKHIGLTRVFSRICNVKILYAFAILMLSLTLIDLQVYQ